MGDIWQHWRDALAGREVAIHEGKPQAGFWKLRRRKDGPWLPVAIWEADGAMICVVAGEAEADVARVWTWCAKRPITEEAYRHWEQHKAWPDDIPAPAARGIGDNRPPATLAERVAETVGAALAWVGATPIDSQLQADIAGNRLTALRDLAKEIKGEWDAKREPILKADLALAQEYKPLAAAIAEVVSRIRDAVNGWIAAEDARRRAEAAKAEAEFRAAEAARRKAEEERRAAIQTAAAEGKPMPSLLPLPEPEAPRKVQNVQIGGAIGQKLGARKTTIVVVTDHAAALAYFADHPKVRELIEKLAAAAVKAGAEVPGTEKREEKRV